MSVYHGKQGKGAARWHKTKKRQEAEDRAKRTQKREKVTVSEALADIFEFLQREQTDLDLLRREGE